MRLLTIDVMPEQNMYFIMIKVSLDVTLCQRVNCSRAFGGLQRLHLRGLRYSLFLSSSDWYDLIKEKLLSCCFVDAARCASLLWAEPSTWLQFYSIHFDPEYRGRIFLNNDKTCLQDLQDITTHNFSWRHRNIENSLDPFTVKLNSLRFFYRPVSGRNGVTCNKIWSFWKSLSE